MMVDTVVCTRPLSEEELNLRKKALRHAVLCIGWVKVTSVICYAILYFLVHVNSKGHMSTVLKIMLLVMIPAQVFHGLILFLGAVDEKLCVLELGLWLCLILASYNTVLGVIGGVYFIRNGHITIHFFLAVFFAIMAISLITVMCHDILIIFAYKKSVQSTPPPEVPNNRMITWSKV
ncbi:uncharacterized protein LOC135077803 [Ostrinia nubilalis]|uniref:uncharacterized protein LOC135077803 n=1 Tax=Ostrinia nubilalis TaxID=29057 RepID=UPI0030825695